MFINHTNHPSSKWGEKQTAHAMELCANEGIADVPFPQIPAGASSDEVQRMAEDKVHELYFIQGHRTILVQGEMTYVHHFINAAKRLGIYCYAACSERIAEEMPDGSIKKDFQFVQFRQY